MERVWLKNYPAGVPHDINPDEYPSLNAMFAESCERFGDMPAYANMGRTLTYSELDELSLHFAAWLQQVAGLAKGDRVALMMPNLLQYPIAVFGALRAGLTIVNTNPLYTHRELSHQLSDSGAKAILILENFAHVLAEVLHETAVETVIITAVGDQLSFPKSMLANLVVRHVRKQVPPWRIPGAVRFNRVLAEGQFLPFAPVPVAHSDIAFLQYTGGTTGIAKGAVLTHRNMVSNLLQACAWLGTKISIGGGDIAIASLPLYHIFSLTANCLAFMRLGACNVLITNPRDFPGFVQELGRHRFTFFSGVNTLFNALMHTPGFAALDFSSLKITLGGGMAVQEAVATQWKKVTGNVLTQAWGLTETSPAACINPFELEEFNGSIGLPIPSTDVSIRDEAGVDLGLNTSGEICVRGPQVMDGYWKRPDETAKVMLPDGWFRTGDLGYMNDEGYVFIQDRKKDMINVSGFNVYPNEVEDVLAKHPGVREVAAVSQPDEKSGEVVAVFIVAKDPGLTADDIVAFCHGELTGYKIPKHVYFRKELPKTNVGKIMRRALRDEVAKLS